MRSDDRVHSPAPEELMEYVDGEGSAAARADIETHLATCAACQALVADQRRLTNTMQAWIVPPAPASLQPPRRRTNRAWWYPTRTIAAGLSAAAIVLIIVAVNQRPRPLSAPPLQARDVPLQPNTPAAEPAPAAPGPVGSLRPGRVAGNIDQIGAGRAQQYQASPAPAIPQAAVRMPSVIRTARLQIVANDFTAVRASVESIVTNAGGFIDLLTVTGDTSRARMLRGTLRVPSDGLVEALNRLRALGQVTEDTQGSQDVTDQIVDLDARLVSARATEHRLTELLRNRTGRLSDVLEVERELTRVRFDIERLDAEKTNVARRVSYATVDLTISETRKEGLDGPLPLTTRLRVAALDGLEAAFDSVAGATLFFLRAGPSLVLWGTLFGLTWLLVRRRFRDSPKPTASE